MATPETAAVAVGAGSVAAGDGVVKRFGATTALSSAAAPGTTGAGTGGTSYTVVAGDTLFGIALRANVTLQELAAANDMQEDDLLLIGQTLVIPGRAAPLPSLSALVPAGSARTGLTGSTTVTGTRPVTTTGVTGTTGVTTTRTTTPTAPSTLSSSSSTASSLLPSPTPRAGASSTVTSTAGTTAGTAAAAGANAYTVAEGDTIITIALAHNLDWQELLALNNLQPDSVIQVGQEIRLR